MVLWYLKICAWTITCTHKLSIKYVHRTQYRHSCCMQAVNQCAYNVSRTIVVYKVSIKVCSPTWNGVHAEYKLSKICVECNYNVVYKLSCCRHLRTVCTSCQSKWVRGMFLRRMLCKKNSIKVPTAPNITDIHILGVQAMAASATFR